MCDQHTEEENEAFLKALSRRQFAAGAAVVAAASATGACATADTPTGGAAISEANVSIKTADGPCDAFFAHPAKGKGAAVIMWPDIMGLREVNRTLARRIAQEGYACLAVNHYYRSKPAPILPAGVEWRSPEGQAIINPMMPALDNAAYMRDAQAFVTWLDAQPQVDRAKKVATMGFCMTGKVAILSAAAVPARVGAGASFHGGGLVTDKPESPHLLIPKTNASYLIAIGQNDDERNPQEKDTLKTAFAAAGRPAEVEVYPAQHGWTMSDFPVYDQVQADRAFSRMFALYKAAL